MKDNHGYRINLIHLFGRVKIIHHGEARRLFYSYSMVLLLRSSECGFVVNSFLYYF